MRGLLRALREDLAVYAAILIPTAVTLAIIAWMDTMRGGVR